MSGEYLCLTVRSHPNEAEADFKSRLSTFWTGMLRNRPDEFEQVYAETVKFAAESGRLTRQYLIQTGIAELLEQELKTSNFDFAPLDSDDIYSKYEATPPDWMWIEH
jgi:hypothetical protein